MNGMCPSIGIHRAAAHAIEAYIGGTKRSRWITPSTTTSTPGPWRDGIWMNWSDGQMECIDSMLCYEYGACLKTAIVPPWRGGVLRFDGLLGSVYPTVSMSTLCVLLAVFVCYVSVPSMALLSCFLLILWISWMCFVGALHVLSVPCTLCIHWLALTMKQSVYLLCACYALDH